MSQMRLGVRLWRERGTKGVRVPLWGWGQCPPKSDTNPLTLPEHPCYYTHRSNTHPNYLKEEPQPRGKPIPGPRGLNVQAHPKGRPTRRPSAQANDAISSYQRPRLSLPPPRRWKAHRLSSAGPVQRRPCRFNAPHHRVRLSRPIARRFSR